MIYIPQEELLNRVGSIYKLVILASERALELNNGSPRLVDTKSTKVSTVALLEIKEGKVGYKIVDAKPAERKR
ncbi:MAG: DNA-directed RNA polymerase subunit omega [Candidatus Omnitrophica bacterium]|nr:DNA-directed RNA polymerase subunit omega [Candidatus Omnitrophota bacterium]